MADKEADNQWAYDKSAQSLEMVRNDPWSSGSIATENIPKISPAPSDPLRTLISSETYIESLGSNPVSSEQQKGMFQVHPYKMPDWAAHLNNAPTAYVKLSELNTPIHLWHVPGAPEAFQVYIKRDDLTGTELSGNKVRNLQVFFAEALSKGCRHVVTGGGPQSGNCRAVALIARMLGLTPHVVIEAVEKREDLGTKGNTLLYRMAGSQIYLAPYEGYESFVRRVEKMADNIRYEEPCYCVPVGGSGLLGLHSFISLFQELMDQGLHERFDDIVITIATGGTAAGLAIANYLTGSKVKVHAVSIGLTVECLTEKIDELLRQAGLGTVSTGDILDIIPGYIGEGYGTVSEQVLDYITQVSSSSGILLDPYYTGKCALGMVTEMQQNPQRFKGKRILFVHTGGIFGLFNGEMDRVLNKEGSVTNNIRCWPDAATSPI